MDEENIYEDLDNFILEQKVEQVQENNKELLQTIEKLEETTKKFNEEISDLKRINHNLERNISALFKTAKNEIERKDKKIAELRKDIDNLKLKKGIKKVPKSVDNNEDLKKELEKSKCVIEQKNRIILSLTKELENVKKELSKQDKQLKRSASHFEDDDLRNRLGKKRKLDDKNDFKRDKSRRPRSRSKSKSREMRFDSRLKSRFDKKRTIRRNRSGSFEQRRNSIIEKYRSKYESSKYSKSRSRSPSSHKIRNNQFSEQHGRRSIPQQEKIKKVRSRSRSSSTDRKKYHKHNEKSEIFTDSLDKNIKCEKKIIHNNHLIKEDSGMSSSNSHTSELLLKCDEIKSNLLEDRKDADLEEGEIDCSLEDINSDEDKLVFKEKLVSLKKEITRNTKKDKKEIKKSNELSEQSKKVLQNNDELLENIIKSEKEIEPLETENKNTETTINTNILPELESKKIIITGKENEIKDFKSHDVLELMVQSNFLDDLNIDEEIIKMRMVDDDKKKKRKEDKARISELKTAISEYKQNIELLKYNLYSDEESEIENEFNKTGSCVDDCVVNNVKQNNLVLKISKGTIVNSNDEPKTVNLKDDTKKNPEVQKTDDVLDKNLSSTNNKQETVVLDKSELDVNKKEKHIQKVEDILDKNILDIDKKVSTKEVIRKSSKDNSKSKETDSQILKNKSSEDDKRKKRKDTNEKLKEEKISTTKSVKSNSINNKTETCVQEPKDTLQSTKTDNIDFKPNHFEQITEKELLEAINNIVEDVKIDENKFKQNFANITNMESVVTEVNNKKPADDHNVVESKLNKILDVESEKKENVVATQLDKDVVTKDKQNEPERKAPLKARRRRAFICIT